jgi:hypothetical protein
MDTLVVNILFFIAIIVLIGLYNYQLETSWPVVRPRLEATWPMFPGAKEGFANMTLEQWLPSPEVLTKTSVGDCPGTLLNAASYEGGLSKPYKSYDLLENGKPEPRIANGPTSQQCYEVDWSRGLEPGGSYAQRTNNYKQNYPDSCSAPNHDLVLDFYKPNPSNGPYQLQRL